MYSVDIVNLWPVRSHWLPRSVTVDKKTAYVKAVVINLGDFTQNANTFFHSIVT